MSVIDGSTVPITSRVSDKQIQSSIQSEAPRPNACTALDFWYYQSPTLNTVYMKPLYHFHRQRFITGATPALCAAALEVDIFQSSFSLLPIPADETATTSEYCKIEYWESYLYNTKQSGITWENLHQGMSVRPRNSRANPLKSALVPPACPAPYSIIWQGVNYHYRRHSSLEQHLPGNFHGYGDFDRSFRDRTRPFLDVPYSIPVQRSIDATGVKFALVVVLLSFILIAAHIRKHTRSPSDDLDHS